MGSGDCVDTSAPLAAHPTSGQVVRFQVSDARPDAQIGIDELADEGRSPPWGSPAAATSTDATG